MKSRPRRIALQITPLVDTLLVVLFLQYVESRQQQDNVLAEAASATRDRNRAAAQFALAESRVHEAQAELDRAHDSLARLAAESRAREERAVQAEA
jgi:hypothetical protein